MTHKWISDSFEWFLDFLMKNSSRDLNIRISTMDNPGFCLKVCLEKTSFGDKKFDQIAIDRSEHDWFHCFVRDKNFEGFCGPTNLSEILAVFREWIEDNHQIPFPKTNKNLECLETWYVRQCDGDWEHENGIEIRFLPDSTCHLLIGLSGTKLEREAFTNIASRRAENDRLECFVQDEKFNGVCSPRNLPEALAIFQKWVKQYQEDFSDFFAHSDLFKKRSAPQIEVNISDLLNKSNEVLGIVTSKCLLNIIPFYDHLHFVFEDGVSFNSYTKTISSKPLSALKGLKILGGEVKYPIIHLELEEKQSIDLDLEHVFDRSFVSIELHVPQKYVGSRLDWTPPTEERKAWTLYLQ